jgi:tripartite-type tricarboxylate transporter receptor subunit TctC
MRRLKRNGISLALSFFAASFVATSARAQDYPNQDIHFISAFPPGSGADVLVRFFAEKLRPIAGRTIIVENKAGAGGNIATEYTARSKPDGYTIFVHAGNTLASNHYLIRNNTVDAAKQIQVAATINRQAFMLVVDAKQPWKTVAELTAHLKERGEKASYATAANSGVIMCDLQGDRRHQAR